MRSGVVSAYVPLCRTKLVEAGTQKSSKTQVRENRASSGKRTLQGKPGVASIAG